VAQAAPTVGVAGAAVVVAAAAVVVVVEVLAEEDAVGQATGDVIQSPASSSQSARPPSSNWPAGEIGQQRDSVCRSPDWSIHSP